ncbi:MAG: hypothetical protein H7Y11_05240, partial [Armatimonadetes bacterium]|nr:hypothetical protein [Anaerolineae bacterium]
RDTTIRRLPVMLCGMRLLQLSSQADEVTAEDFVSFTLDAPARVWVAYAGSATRIPEWLRTFTPEEADIDLADEWWGGKVQKLYSREYPAGRVVLGGNRAFGALGRCDPQYLVLIEG